MSFDSNIKEMEAMLQRLLTSARLRFAEAVWHDVPALPGIYLIEEGGVILYIGSAANLNTRLWQEHYLGKKVRPGGSQFRGALARARRLSIKQLTAYMREHSSFSVVVLDPIEKRLLKFIENYCNAIVRPELIELGSKGVVWMGERVPVNPVQYQCECCGRTFLSGRRRQPPWYCKTCAE